MCLCRHVKESKAWPLQKKHPPVAGQREAEKSWGSACRGGAAAARWALGSACSCGTAGLWPHSLQLAPQGTAQPPVTPPLGLSLWHTADPAELPLAAPQEDGHADTELLGIVS